MRSSITRLDPGIAEVADDVMYSKNHIVQTKVLRA